MVRHTLQKTFSKSWLMHMVGWYIPFYHMGCKAIYADFIFFQYYFRHLESSWVNMGHSKSCALCSGRFILGYRRLIWTALAWKWVEDKKEAFSTSIGRRPREVVVLRYVLTKGMAQSAKDRTVKQSPVFRCGTWLSNEPYHELTATWNVSKCNASN